MTKIIIIKKTLSITGQAYLFIFHYNCLFNIFSSVAYYLYDISIKDER